ncbi:hypothetical protein D7Y13_22540 [Corallococcus praedator]|uniref:Uncharacterized protein n=1 Tax=Corallococcus praedator TaxID=2316724 RepID=A0ABX9QE33_9BACT|nr:hypothetical protein D7X75_25710 [Corallococcus sp. CA031C]RKI03244.1 hypothetical protein D7Y13_22540 [Corallococcus praedator]
MSATASLFPSLVGRPALASEAKQDMRILDVVARLKPGVTLEAAREQRQPPFRTQDVSCRHTPMHPSGRPFRSAPRTPPGWSFHCSTSPGRKARRGGCGPGARA